MTIRIPVEDDLTMADATNTVRLHRVLRASPERVYRAFLDLDALARWLPPHGFTGRCIISTHYERIRYTDQFDGPGPSRRFRTRAAEAQEAV